jgi:AcrR family transcriptional regulator
MGRPRQHDEQTRASLVAAAEQLVAAAGPDALSVREVAARAGTTTRAVYSVFGSKQGLLTALAEQAYRQLHATVAALPETDDPVADLIAAGVHGFRPLVRDHPSLFRIAFQRVVPGLQPAAELTAARERALAPLTARVRRVRDAGLLGSKTILEAAIQFHTMCEGLANAELRGAILPILPEGDEETAWRDGLSTLVMGFQA